MNRNIPSLDGLRAISILLVLVSHASINIYSQSSNNFTRLESIIQNLATVGHLGVLVFFTISGFLITTLLLKDETINLRRFYFRRTLRIFPPYYFYLFVIFLLYQFGYITVPTQDFWAAFTYTTNYFSSGNWYLGHTWSLAVEEQFYLTVPILIYILGKKNSLRIFFLIMILCPLFRLLYILYDPATPVEFNRFETVADSLAAGCLLAGLRGHLHQQKWYLDFLNSKLLFAAPFVIIFITWLARFPNYYPKSFYVLAAISVQNILIALCIDWTVTNNEGIIGRVLNAKPIAFIGLISYSIYLWQQLFLSPYLNIPIPLKIILIMFVSVILYFCIEKTSLKLRNFLEKRYI